MSLTSSQKATDILNAKASSARGPKPACLDEQIKSSVVRHNRLLDEAFDLFCVLRYQGETVNAEEFCARYPAIQHSLARLLAAHRYLEDHLELVDVDLLENCPVPGDIFVGFRLERELGRGAFARVFQARELALGERQVALKISPQGTGTAEAATLGRMVHPNIVPIFSVAEDEESGLTAVCMPYLGQATLLNILDHVYGQPAPEPTAASLLEAIEEIPGAPPVIPPSILAGGSYVDGVRWLAIQLAEALAFIHAKGICHRDLKPSNILMRADGTPMLLDFNLAEDMQAPCDRQGGTPSYMSPEHLRSLNGLQTGDPERPGTRSDLYSLGVILYELLSGTHPFGPLPLNASGTKMMPLLLERQQGGFRPIRECRPEVDVVLADIVEKCLSWEPARRPGFAADIVRALRRSQRPRARAGRWLRRRRKSVAAAGLLLVAMGLAVALQLATRPPEYMAQMRLGKLASEKSDFEAAVHHYTESLRAKLDQPEVLFARGKAYMNLIVPDGSNFSLASADFRQANQFASEGKYIAYIAYGLHKQDQIPAAISLYDQALRRGFCTAGVYNNLAYLYTKRAQLKEAQEKLDLALGIAPNLHVAHYNQAYLCFKMSLQAKHDADKEALLEKGITHYRRAQDQGILTGEMTLFGAELYSRASLFRDSWSEAALVQFAKAIEQGIDPRSVRGNGRFTMLRDKPGFDALLTRTPPPDHPPTAAVVVVEPLSE